MMAPRLQTACLALACFGAALGCEKAEPPSPAAESSAAAKSAAPVAIAPAAAPARVDLETVPAREDFEEEAATAITPANLEKQLQALEQEMSGE